jgi:hypothetical protein
MPADTRKPPRIRTGPDIDPFRVRQVPGVAGRFTAERGRHQRAADLM